MQRTAAPAKQALGLEVRVRAFKTRSHRRRALYSITSSARASSAGGTINPNTFAVLALITNS